MNRASVIVILILASLGAWWYFRYAENETKREQARKAREEFEARRMQQADPLMRFAGCMANHASLVSQISAAQAIHTLHSGKTIKGEEYAEYMKMRDSLVAECRRDYGKELSASYPSLTNDQLNRAFLTVMAQDPEVIEWLNSLGKASEAERKAYVK